jgi:hypothetical protein
MNARIYRAKNVRGLDFRARAVKEKVMGKRITGARPDHSRIMI